MDKSREIKAEANSSEIAHFSFWFNSINFCFSEVCVTTNTEKEDNPNMDTADAQEPSLNIVNTENVGGAEVDRADKPGIDMVESDGSRESGYR